VNFVPRELTLRDRLFLRARKIVAIHQQATPHVHRQEDPAVPHGANRPRAGTLLSLWHFSSKRHLTMSVSGGASALRQLRIPKMQR
jgi:hypothetical protein